MFPPPSEKSPFCSVLQCSVVYNPTMADPLQEEEEGEVQSDVAGYKEWLAQQQGADIPVQQEWPESGYSTDLQRISNNNNNYNEKDGTNRHFRSPLSKVYTL